MEYSYTTKWRSDVSDPTYLIRLKAALKDAGVTQAAFAGMCGCSPSNISRMLGMADYISRCAHPAYWGQMWIPKYVWRNALKLLEPGYRRSAEEEASDNALDAYFAERDRIRESKRFLQECEEYGYEPTGIAPEQAKAELEELKEKRRDAVGNSKTGRLW
jgi:hypothetical protein